MLDPEVRDIIQRARDLIADPERWCQRFTATGNDENAVTVARMFDVPVAYLGQSHADPTSPFAAKWCAYGALRKAARVDDAHRLVAHKSGGPFALACDIIRDAAERLHPDSSTAQLGPIAWVNDHLGHDAVLAMFDKVLADERIA